MLPAYDYHQARGLTASVLEQLYYPAHIEIMTRSHPTSCQGQFDSVVCFEKKTKAHTS